MIWNIKKIVENCSLFLSQSLFIAFMKGNVEQVEKESTHIQLSMNGEK